MTNSMNHMLPCTADSMVSGIMESTKESGSPGATSAGLPSASRLRALADADAEVGGFRATPQKVPCA